MMRTPIQRGPGRRAVCRPLVLVLLVAASTTFAQDQEQPPPRQGVGEFRLGLPRLQYEVRGYYVTWFHWWETNRDVYLGQAMDRLRRSRPAPRYNGVPGVAAPKDERARLLPKAVEALLRACESDHPLVREGAALALGRTAIGADDDAWADLTDKALTRLRQLTRDDYREVRRAAWIGLGLLGGEAARVSILEADVTVGDSDLMSWTVALIALDRPDDRLYEAMLAVLRERRAPAAQHLALWGLIVHRHPRLRDICLDLLRTTDQPALAELALIGVGIGGEPADAESLAEVAHHVEKLDLPVLRKIEATTQRPPGGVQIPGSLQHDPGRWHHPALRAAAAMGISHLADRLNEQQRRRIAETLRQAYLRVLEQQEPMAHRAPMLLALGRLNDAANLPFLDAAMADQPPGVEVLVSRGLGEKSHAVIITGSGRLSGSHAAIAAALHLRRMLTPAEDDLQRAKDIEALAGAIGLTDLRQSLRTHLLRKQNPTERRSACAIALALANLPQPPATRNRPDQSDAPASYRGRSHPADHHALLDAAARAADGGDQVLFGYTLLALAMLGDERVVPAADKYLGPKATEIDVPGRVNRPPPRQYDIEATMGRRAAALALGVLGDEGAAPILIGEWGRNFWVDLEAARALNWLDDYSIAVALAELAVQRKQRVLAISAVWSLGELFDPTRPPRVSRLVIGLPFADHWHRLYEAVPQEKFGHGEAPFNFAYPFEWWLGYGNTFQYGGPLIIKRRYRYGSGTTAIKAAR